MLKFRQNPFCSDSHLFPACPDGEAKLSNRNSSNTNLCPLLRPLSNEFNQAHYLFSIYPNSTSLDSLHFGLLFFRSWKAGRRRRQIEVKWIFWKRISVENFLCRFFWSMMMESRLNYLKKNWRSLTEKKEVIERQNFNQQIKNVRFFSWNTFLYFLFLLH